VKYIITGGPGSGKTSIIETLSRLGYTTFPEVSRTLIRQQMLLEQGVLPWKNMNEFARLALTKMRQQYRDACGENRVCFFDRGIPDIIGYLHFSGLELSPEVSEATVVHRYAPVVFVCPPWDEIYVNDPERPQTFEDALGLYHHIRNAYETLQYRIIEVPKDVVSVRTEFILDVVHLHQSIAI
jgi:predicted ATPase